MGDIICLLDDVAEIWTPPGPVVVVDDVGGVGHEWSVVSVELTRLVRSTRTVPCEVTLQILSVHLRRGQLEYMLRHNVDSETRSTEVAYTVIGSCQKDGSCTSHRPERTCS